MNRDAYMVNAAVSGAAQKDLNVSAQDQMLTIEVHKAPGSKGTTNPVKAE